MKKLLCFSLLLFALTLVVAGCGDDKEVSINVSPSISTVEASEPAYTYRDENDAEINVPAVMRKVMLTVTAKNTELVLDPACKERVIYRVEEEDEEGNITVTETADVGPNGYCRQVGRYTIEYTVPYMAGTQTITIASMEDKGKTATAEINVIWAAPRGLIEIPRVVDGTPVLDINGNKLWVPVEKGRIKTPRSQSGQTTLEVRARFTPPGCRPGLPPENCPPPVTNDVMTYSATSSNNIGSITNTYTETGTNYKVGVFTPQNNKGTGTLTATTQYLETNRPGGANTYRNVVTSMIVNVVEVEHLVITTVPPVPASNQHYNYEPPNTNGLKLVAVCTDGEMDEISESDFILQPLEAVFEDESSTQGAAVATIGYQEGDVRPADVSFDVVVNRARAGDITISEESLAAVKKEYGFSQTFDSTGLVVTVSYPDGTTRDITTGYTLNPVAAMRLVPSNTSVTVSFTDGGRAVTTQIPITVRPVTSLSVTPNKTAYNENDNLEAANLTVTPTFAGGYTVAGYNLPVSSGTGNTQAGYVTDPAIGTRLKPEHEENGVTVSVSANHGEPMPAGVNYDITVEPLKDFGVFEWITPVEGATSTSTSPRPWITGGNVVAAFNTIGQRMFNKTSGELVELPEPAPTDPNALPALSELTGLTVPGSGGYVAVTGIAKKGDEFAIVAIERQGVFDSGGLDGNAATYNNYSSSYLAKMSADYSSVLIAPVLVGNYFYDYAATPPGNSYGTRVAYSATDDEFVVGYTRGISMPTNKMIISKVDPSDLTLTDVVAQWEGTESSNFSDLRYVDENNFVAVGSKGVYSGSAYTLVERLGNVILMDNGTKYQFAPELVGFEQYRISYVIPDGNQYIVVGTGTQGATTVGFVAKTLNKYFTKPVPMPLADQFYGGRIHPSFNTYYAYWAQLGYWSGPSSLANPGGGANLNSLGIPNGAYILHNYNAWGGSWGTDYTPITAIPGYTKIDVEDIPDMKPGEWADYVYSGTYRAFIIMPGYTTPTEVAAATSIDMSPGAHEPDLDTKGIPSNANVYGFFGAVPAPDAIGGYDQVGDNPATNNAAALKPGQWMHILSSGNWNYVVIILREGPTTFVPPEP